MIMKVITPGPLSTIQDGGRFGYMSTGFGSGGAMDLRAMRIANILVGNHENDGVIEKLLKKFDNTKICEIDFSAIYENYPNLPKPEKTDFGYHIMPDSSQGAGPLFFCLIQKL